MKHVITLSRQEHDCGTGAHRQVYVSELASAANGKTLERIVADQAPLFYRRIQDVAAFRKTRRKDGVTLHTAFLFWKWCRCRSTSRSKPDDF